MLILALDLPAALGLGQEATTLTFVQISLRGVIVFMATLAIIRCGDRRFLSQKTAFDAVLGFILASMLARAVNGTAAFFSHSWRRIRSGDAAPRPRGTGLAAPMDSVG